MSLIRKLFHGAALGAFALHINLAAAAAFTPTQAQIEQFKKLSPEEQKRLAESMGIQLPANLGETAGDAAINRDSAVPPVLPRGATPMVGDAMVVPTLPDKVPSKKDELQPFGYELFSGQPLSFSPLTDVPVPSEYIVGPGDIIVIQLFGKENQTHRLTVNRQGAIQFPNLGPITVSGLAFENMRNTLLERVKKQMIGVEANITLGELRSMRIFMMGEVFQPGAYTVSALSSITNALYLSGGVRHTGSLRHIQLKRAGKLVSTFDLYDLLLKGDNKDDARLLPGDVIFIPPVGATVSVLGEVKRPAIYELKPNETVSDLLSFVGGVNPNAYLESVSLERINKNRLREANTIDLSSAAVLNAKLQNGDFITISAITDKVNNAVELSGAVARPGAYQWTSGMRVSSLLKEIAVDLLQNTDLDYAVIVREINERRDIEVRQFDLGEALINKGQMVDPELNARDRVLVFDRELKAKKNRTAVLAPVLEQLRFQARADQPLAIVDIQGAVRYPGSYPYFKGMTVRDLVNAGGGLLDSAYRPHAEITRVDVSDSQTANLKQITLELDKAIKGDMTANAVLENRDRLLVRVIPDWQENQTITLKGEVQFPGAYTFRRGETLSSVIKRAGGLTAYADPNAAIFMREELRKVEAERIKQARAQLEAQLAAEALSADSSTTAAAGKKVSAGDAKKLIEQLDKTTAMGRLIIDLPIIMSGQKEKDIRVENSDVLIILPKRESVTVVGEVLNPTTHVYTDHFNKEDYIERSGGLTKQADDDRVYVIRANGAVAPRNDSFWFRKESEKLVAGDTVVVPLDTEYMSALPMWTSITQIIYQSAVAIAAIGSL